MSFSLETLALFFGAGLFAGVVDAIAGGGGLITLPTLLLGGLDPVSALATNKLQGSVGTATATFRFTQAGMLDFRSRETWRLAASSFGGAAVGAALVTVAPVEAMRVGLPFLLIAVALYFIFGPKLSDVDGRPRLSPVAFALGVAMPIGAYDGVFGPGTGSFFMIALVGLAGFGAVKAVARTKLLNLSSNLASLIIFVIGGHVVWTVGAVMGCGALIGARLGAGLALKHGVKLVRPLVIVVALALSLRLMLDAGHPVGAAFWAAMAGR